MNFYKNSRKAIKLDLQKKFPDIKPERVDGKILQKDLPCHLLWMVEEMENWDASTIKQAVKAGRWIGWMYRAMEELNLWDNNTSRLLSWQDVNDGYSLPH